MNATTDISGLVPIQAPGLAPGRVELKEQFSVNVRALQEGRDGGWIKRLPDVIIGETVYPRFLVRCQGQHCGIVNRNRRMYPAETTWRPSTMEDSAFMRRIGARRVTGQLEHPADGRSAMPLGAILVTKVEQPDAQGRVFIEFETLTTDHGMVVAHYIMDGVGFGVSSRGNGSVIRNAEGIDVVQADFEPTSFDLVCDESTPGAEVTATLMRLRESRVRLLESVGGDVTKAEQLALQRTAEAIERDNKAGRMPIAGVGALSSAAAKAAVREAGGPPLGASEYLLGIADGSGHYRAHMNGVNQWDVWLHVHNLVPELIASNMPTRENAKMAAENHLRLVVGEAVERGLLMVSGPVTSKVFADLKKKPRTKLSMMREGYEVKTIAPYTGTMVELVASTDEEAKKIASALEKAGFHIEHDGDCVYVHTAYAEGQQAVAHIARVLGSKDIEMRESLGARLAAVAKGKVVWAEPVRERINAVPGDMDGPTGTFPEAGDPQATRAGRTQADRDDLDGESFDLDDILGHHHHDHEEPDGDENMTINLIVLDPEDLGDLLGGDFDETSGPEDLQTKQSAGIPGSAGVGPKGTTTGASPQGYDKREPDTAKVKSPGTPMSQSHETSGPEDLQTAQSRGIPGDAGIGDVGAPGGGPMVALDFADAEGGGAAAGPATGPGASGYSTPGTPPVSREIPGGGEYESYEMMRERHAREMAGCPYEGYGDMSMRHASEMHAMRERMKKRHENVNEAGSGYGTPNPLDDPEDIDLDLDHVKEPKVDLNYESAMKKARAHAAEAKRLQAFAQTLNKGPVTEAMLKPPTGAKSSVKMPRPEGKAGKVLLYFSEKDEFIEAREFDEKNVLVRRAKPKLAETGKPPAAAPAPAATDDQKKKDEARKAKLAADAKQIMAGLAETKPAAPAATPAPATPPAPAAPPAAPQAESVDELKKRNRQLTDEVARLDAKVKQLEELVDNMADNQRVANVKVAVREQLAKHPELEKVRARLESLKRPEDVVNEAAAFISVARATQVNETTRPNGAAPDGKIIPMPTAPTTPAPPKPTNESATAPGSAPAKTASASSASTPDAPSGPVADETGADFLGEGLRASSTVDESDTSRRVAEARRRRDAALNGKK